MLSNVARLVASRCSANFCSQATGLEYNPLVAATRASRVMRVA